MNPRDILKRPIITEKSMTAAMENKYTFEVDLRANKIQVRRAVEQIFGVTVTNVTTLRTKPKQRRRGRTIGWTKEMKKAVVTLKDGDKIEINGTPLLEI
ncbi:MAG: 50S ribosomal protein L23 [Candidatus Eremiobacterota bacterium]